jgi:hypothetical protein
MRDFTKGVSRHRQGSNGKTFNFEQKFSEFTNEGERDPKEYFSKVIEFG